MAIGTKIVNHFRYTFSFGSDKFDASNRFETSWLVSPWTLFCIRATLAVWGFFNLFFSLGWIGTHKAYGGSVADQQSFSYFTWLTYWGLCFYFLAASIQTFSYARWGAPLLDRWPRPLQAMHSLFYSSIICFPFLVTIVFWGVIYDGHWYTDAFSRWSNVSIHGLNSFMALLELTLPRTDPPPFVHVFWLVVLLALYCGLAYITDATEGFYVYTFLDPSTSGEGAVVGYVFGIGIAIIIIFCIAKVLVMARKWATENKGHRLGKFHDDRSFSQAGDVEMETSHIVDK